MWLKATDSQLSNKGIISRNVLGYKLSEYYRSYFTIFRAFPDNAESLRETWCPPIHYSIEINDKLKSDILNVGPIYPGKLFDFPEELFDRSEDKIKILKLLSDKFITHA